MSKEEITARVKTTFNTAADYFDAPPMSFWNYFAGQTLDRLSLTAGDRVLDVCCGSGASAIPAAEIVGDRGYVLGVDLAENLLTLARQKARDRRLENIEFRTDDFENLGLPAASFDAIVCIFGIFFVPDMPSALADLWRMVRPGGKLAITTWGKKVFEPGNSYFWEVIQIERPDLYRQSPPWAQIDTPESLQALLTAAGLTHIELIPEVGQHSIASAADWWTMVMGGGYRGIIEQLDPDTRERLKAANLDFLEQNNIRALEFEVMYAIASKE